MSRLVAVGLVMALAACSSPEPALRVDATANGTQVASVVGDRVEIALPGNPTTGYTWVIAAIDETVMRSLGEPDFEADSTLVGSGGTMTLAFEVVGAGTTTLELAYRRPFETVPPEDTFTLTVVATG